MAVTKIWFRNYVDDVLTTATSVKLSDPDGTYGIRMLNSPNTVLVADDTATTETSTGIFEYGTAGSPISAIAGYDSTEPYEYYFEVTQSAGDVDYIRGVIAAQTGYPAFSDAYTEVKTDTDNLVGNAEAKRLINEALRMVANDRNWDWVVGDAVYDLTLVANTKQYTLPIHVQHVIGAYSDGLNIRQYRILPYTDFELINPQTRISGTPRTLFLFGDNVVMPDPYPDSNAAGNTISIYYKKNFHLTADADNFPCNRDFVDAIKTLAKHMAAKRKGKSELAKHFGSIYEVMMFNLRSSQLGSEFIVPGAPGYKF